MPRHRAVLQLQLLLPLLEDGLLIPQALLRPLDRVALQVYPMSEKLQFGTAFELVRVGKRVPQVVGVRLLALGELILQVLELLQLPPQVLYRRTRPFRRLRAPHPGGRVGPHPGEQLLTAASVA